MKKPITRRDFLAAAALAACTLKAHAKAGTAGCLTFIEPRTNCRNDMGARIAILLSMTLIIACSGSRLAGLEGRVTLANPSDLDAAIDKNGVITFRSWNGKWIGMDADTHLTFLPGRRVHMTEFGYAVNAYDGTYTINDRAVVTASFDKFKHGWPVMILKRDSKSLLLVPQDSRNTFVMGNRRGATFRGDQGTYWPFRPISAEDQAAIKRRLRNRPK